MSRNKRMSTIIAAGAIIVSILSIGIGNQFKVFIHYGEVSH